MENSATPSQGINRVLLEGHLKKHTGGVFFGAKKRWACLSSDGTLALSKKREFPPYVFLRVDDFSEYDANEDDQSFSFCSVMDGVILKGVKFYVVDSPSFDEWTRNIQELRTKIQSEKSTESPRRRQVLQAQQRNFSMRQVFLEPDDKLRETLSTRDIDPILSVQAGGEPVIKSGSVRKRGGGNGGNRAYKKRWFVLTKTGRVLYFKNASSCASLGQFSLFNASMKEVGSNELQVMTDSRTWELQFDSECERSIWASALMEVIDQDNPPADSIVVPRGGGLDDVLQARNKSFIHSSTIALGFHAANHRDSGKSTQPGIRFDRVSGRELLSSSSGHWDEVSVACVTWNLAECLPKMVDIRFMKELRSCQVVSVGVQECQSVMYHTFGSDQLSPVDVWLVMVKGVLGSGFTLVASRAMGAIHICVFVRHDILDAVSNVSTAYVPCGIGNVMHNKGAVGVSMKFYDTTVAFICAHLAANREKLIERNHDFHRISSHLIDLLGRSAMDQNSRNETVDDEAVNLEFCDIRPQERRSTMVEVESNPLAHIQPQSPAGWGKDTLPVPDTRRVKSGPGKATRDADSSKGSKQQQQGPIDTGNRLSMEFDRCFFFGDLNYRLEVDKKWAQTLLSMSEKMIALEDERLMKECRRDGTTTSGRAQQPTGLSSLQDGSSSSGIRRGSSIGTQEMDNILESSGLTCPKSTAPQLLKNQEELSNVLKRLSTKVGDLSAAVLSQWGDRDEKELNLSEDTSDELQLLLNLVPVGDFGSDDEDEEDVDTPKSSRSNAEVGEAEMEEDDDDVKMMHKLESGTPADMDEWRMSSGVMTDCKHDETISEEICQTVPTAAVDTAPSGTTVGEQTDAFLADARSSVGVAQRKASVISLGAMPSGEYHTIFGNMYRKPLKHLSASAKHALEFFKDQTGFQAPQDIYDRLMFFDQLLAERTKGAVLQGFEEGRVMFKPSYKFDPFTETYDTGKKSRAPAWCDRILYNSPRYEKEIELKTYECIHGEFHSDHRAVVAIFSVKL